MGKSQAGYGPFLKKQTGNKKFFLANFDLLFFK